MSLLALNGYLINLGPLLYHFEDQGDPFVEFTYSEIMKMLPAFGFKLVYERRERMQCNVNTQSGNSMYKMHYECAFWISRMAVIECNV